MLTNPEIADLLKIQPLSEAKGGTGLLGDYSGSIKDEKSRIDYFELIKAKLLKMREHDEDSFFKFSGKAFRILKEEHKNEVDSDGGYGLVSYSGSGGGDEGYDEEGESNHSMIVKEGGGDQEI